MSVRPAGRLHIGVALGATQATAVARAGGATLRATVRLHLPEGEDPSPAIAAAFKGLADQLAAALGRQAKSARVHVALLPPLGDTRLVPLPRLRAAEAEAVIRRDAARHFVGSNEARVVAVSLNRQSRGQMAFGSASPPVLAAATSVPVAEAVRAAAGWMLGGIVPAHAAWLRLAQQVGGRRDAGQAKVVVAVIDDAAHVLRIEGGSLTALRRVPAAWLDEIVEAAGPVAGSAIVLAEDPARSSIGRTLAAAGWTLREPANSPVSAAEAAAMCAARAGLSLLPPSLAAEQRAGTRKLAVRIAAAAAFLILGTAVVQLWGAQRELEAVHAQRMLIRDQVAPLLAMRDSINRLNDASHMVAAMEGSAPRWTRALFDLALLLPGDTHVTALNAKGDTLLFDAVGSRAGESIQALRRAGSLTDVRLIGNVERDIEGGTTSVERFHLGARLAPIAEPEAHTALALRNAAAMARHPADAKGSR